MQRAVFERNEYTKGNLYAETRINVKETREWRNEKNRQK